MSCICQYFVHSKDRNETEDYSCSHAGAGAVAVAVAATETVDQNFEPLLRSEISASELATAKAENWLLNKNLTEARITIENLESLVKTIMDKQNIMLTEMYHLKHTNQESEEECRLQRDYHTMERNAMMRELQDTKAVLQKRSKLLEDTLQKNKELTNEVQDVNQKIYLMGMKYLRLKNERSYHSSEQSDEEQSHEVLTDGESSDDEHSDEDQLKQ